MLFIIHQDFSGAFLGWEPVGGHPKRATAGLRGGGPHHGTWLTNRVSSLHPTPPHLSPLPPAPGGALGTVGAAVWALCLLQLGSGVRCQVPFPVSAFCLFPGLPTPTLHLSPLSLPSFHSPATKEGQTPGPARGAGCRRRCCPWGCWLPGWCVVRVDIAPALEAP